MTKDYSSYLMVCGGVDLIITRHLKPRNLDVVICSILNVFEDGLNGSRVVQLVVALYSMVTTIRIMVLIITMHLPSRFLKIMARIIRGEMLLLRCQILLQMYSLLVHRHYKEALIIVRETLGLNQCL